MEKPFDVKLKEVIEEICSQKESWLKPKVEKISWEEFISSNRINKSTFGSIIGVSGSTITKYLSSPENLKISQVKKLADETNIDVRNLIDIISSN